ncbi:MAG: hypothetical protein GY811_02545 [Myxococcales bacterium]|nr:hypothetical protein [Myxococcales bacterium]
MRWQLTLKIAANFVCEATVATGQLFAVVIRAALDTRAVVDRRIESALKIVTDFMKSTAQLAREFFPVIIGAALNARAVEDIGFQCAFEVLADLVKTTTKRACKLFTVIIRTALDLRAILCLCLKIEQPERTASAENSSNGRVTRCPRHKW